LRGRRTSSAGYRLCRVHRNRRDRRFVVGIDFFGKGVGVSRMAAAALIVSGPVLMNAST
jgi:hypothetical protein